MRFSDPKAASNFLNGDAAARTVRPPSRNPLMVVNEAAVRKANEQLLRGIILSDDQGVMSALKAGAQPDTADENGTALIHACKVKNAKVVSWLLEFGADTSLSDKEGCTALHIACGDNEIGIVQNLLKKQANVDLTNSHGETALIFSAKKKADLPIIKALIEAGADINAADQSNATVLEHAITAGCNLALLEYLAAKGAKLGHIKTSERFSNLLNASMSIDKSMFDFVVGLAGGPDDFNTCDSQGRLPLVHAISLKSEESVAALINAGANFDCCQKDRTTPMVHVARTGTPVMLDLFLQRFGTYVLQHKCPLGMTAFMHAILGGNKQMVEKILDEAGYQPETDRLGRPPLVLAILSRSKEVVDVILKKVPQAYADRCSKSQILFTSTVTKQDPPSVVNNFGPTPLMVAFLVGEVQIIEDILSRIPKEELRPNDLDAYDQTTLMYACNSGQVQSVKRALKLGADASKKDLRGYNAMFHAAWGGDLGSVSLLHGVFQGCNLKVDISAGNGLTPLMLASERGHVDLVRHFLKFVANADKKDAEGHTPIMYALWEAATPQKLQVAEKLLNSGAKINRSTRWFIEGHPETFSILDRAVLSGFDTNIDFLLKNGANVKSRHVEAAIKHEGLSGDTRAMLFERWFG